MKAKVDFHVIAHIHTDFPTKFGIPRQSGLVEGLRAVIVFEPPYRRPEALRGLEDFSHLWLIWQFSEAIRAKWSPTVRPPRLGGNTRVGVFATRSPFRPNPIGLSSVRLEGIVQTESVGTVLHVSGADLMDGTPIYDIKPYLAFTDSHPAARGGFSDRTGGDRLQVTYAPDLRSAMDSAHFDALLALLRSDPRPSYQDDPTRIYGFPFAGYEVRFSVRGEVLTLLSIERKVNDFSTE